MTESLAQRPRGLRVSLIEMRSEYTGESVDLASDAVARALRNLNREQRAAIIDEIQAKKPYRDLEKVRRELLPAAGTAEQQWIESAVLAALKPTAKLVDRLPSPIMWAHPAPDYLSIKLRSDATIPFLLTLMPRMIDGTLVGVPGLRLKPSRRSLVVYHINAPDDVVGINGIPRHCWNQLASDLIDASGDVDVFRLWGPPIGNGLAFPDLHASPHPLTAAESSASAEWSSEPEIDAVASALLRRSGLFSAVGVWRRDGTRFRLNASNPTEIGDALCDPLFGIPYRVTNNRATVTVTTRWEGWE